MTEKLLTGMFYLQCGIALIKYLILPDDEIYLAKEVIGLQIMGILTLFFTNH